MKEVEVENNVTEQEETPKAPTLEKVEPQQDEKADKVVATTLETLIRGKNDIFDRTFKFKELGEEFRIKVRYPTFMERSRINARREELLQGTSYQQPFAVYLVNQTISLFEVVGIGIPEYFSVDGTPRDDVILHIGLELDEWMSTFR